MYQIIVILLSVLIYANGGYEFTTKHFEVPLDHFSFTTNATFKIRYLVNDTYHRQRGPIFFYTGNEGDISMFAQNTGFMFDIAKQFNALIIFAEHRYYGESLPFGNKSYDSPAHLGFLSSGQALADFVDLIDFLQDSYSVTKDLKKLPVVAFGGSYGGMLSSWLRMKYPDSVIGAIASSAPIWQFKDLIPCENYYKITTNVYEISSNVCSRVIQDSWNIIRQMSKNETGRSELVKIFKLCDSLTNDVDIDKFNDWLANIYIDLAMMNYPYPTNFLIPLPGYPVSEFCSRIGGNKTNQDILGKLSYAIQLYTNGTGLTKCNQLKEKSPNLGELGWDFQSCTEMIMPFCSTDQDMFETQPWDFKKFSDDCYKQFGVRPRNEKIPVLEYGGKNLEMYSNIVFSNGLRDPWSSGGVLTNISSSIVAVLIPDGAHHFDLRAQDPKDTFAVQEARQFHIREISKWLNDYYFANLMDPLKYQFIKRISNMNNEI